MTIIEKMKTYYPPSENAGGWRKNTQPDFVSSLGIDPPSLERLGAFSMSIPNNQWRPWCEHKACLVIKNGWIIGEWYEGEDSQNFLQYLASNGKSAAMVCFGILMGEKEGRALNLSLDSPLYDLRWLPQGFPLSDFRKAEITFRQVFQHVSGICPETEEAGRYQKDKDYTSWVVGHDPLYPDTATLYYAPGYPEQYQGPNRHRFKAYSSVAMQHIGLVISNLVGIPAHVFLEKRLLEPLGIDRVDYFQPVREWSAGSRNQEIIWHTEGGLRLTPRDYARFAYFLLRDGMWGGRQMVPVAYLEEFRVCSAYANILGNFDGGFGKSYPQDLFRISGAGGNWAYMLPSQDLIALRCGRCDDDLIDAAEEEFLRLLFMAAR